MPDPANSDPPARLYRCSKCNKTYYRSSHLRRHEVTHSSEKSSRCCFCNRSFAKVEVARRHSKACAGKSNAPPPPQAKRGRKARACDRCSQYKVSCDAQNPCSRCISQNKPCTYQRLAGESGGSNPAHSKAPFLLSFTESSNDTTITAFFLDGSWNANANDESASCHRFLFGSPEDALTGFHSSAWDAVALSNYYDQGFTVGVDGDHLNNAVFGDISSGQIMSLDIRIDEIIRHLWVTYNDMFRTSVEGCPPFNMDLAKTVFSVNNAKQFMWSFFHRFHEELPIIHRPTFHLDTATSELLIAIILGGAAFSAPVDDALSARRFIPIADEFIFTQLQRRLQAVQAAQPCDLRIEDIQNMQAAMILIMIQSGFNDIPSRRRVKSRRHPQLVSMLRSLGLLSSRRRALATWQDFIEDETRVRLAIFTFMTDNHFCTFFNQPPQVSVSEMTGDLPCPEGLWEANNSTQFEHLNALELEDVPPPQSVRHFVNTLMHGPWSDDPSCPCRNASHFNLYIAIAALQSVTYTARTSCLGPASYQAILRATERWLELWGTGPSIPGGDPRKHAFLRHANETCWLVRTVAKVAQSGDMSSGYMQNLSSDSFNDLHDFIKKYGYL